MAKFLHTADCHIGYRQYGLQEREEDFYRALSSIKEIAKQENVDAVIMAGDIFDSSKPSARAVLEVAKFVRSLKTSGIDVVGIEGNHDLTKEDYWLRVCDIFPLDKAPFENSFTGVSVIGFDYRRGDELLSAIENFDGNRKYPVVVLHCGVAELGAGFAPDVSAAQLVPLLKRLGCSYVALGHIHTPSEQVLDGIMFVQPGSIEMKSADEPKSKFVEIVEIGADGSVVSAKQVPYATRSVVFLDVHDEESLEKAASAARENHGENRPLFIAYVSKDVRDGVQRVSEAFKNADALGKVIPVGSEKAESYDREKSMDLLKDAVTAFFDEGDVRYKMVMDILSTGNPRIVVENYLNSRDD